MAILMPGDIHNYHMFTYMNGYSLFVDRYLRYGKNHYTLGLPEGKIFASSLDPALVKGPIEAEVGYPVTISSSYFSDLKIGIYVYQYLEHAYPGWSLSNNSIILDPGATDVLVYRYSHYETNTVHYAPGITGIPGTTITIHFVRASGGGSPVEVVIPRPDDGIYAHVVYHRGSGTATVKRHWVYKPNGKYPAIDAVINNATPFGDEFLPIVPIRIDGKMLSETRDPDLYPSCRKILKKLWIDIDDIQDALNGKNTPEGEDKPDIDDLDDTWFLFGVDIYNGTKQSAEYLFRFLSGLHDRTGPTKTAYIASKVNIFSGEEALISVFSIAEGQFKMFLQYNYIDILPPVTGTLEKEYVKTVHFEKTDFWMHYEHDGDGNPYPSRVMLLENSYVSIKKRERDANRQLTGKIIELVLHGPIHVSDVKALGHRKLVLKRIDKSFIDSVSKRGQSGFYFPVSHTTLDEIYDRVDQEIILYDSMILALYAGHVEHLEWYETGIFRALLIVVLAVVSVVLAYTGNPAAGITVAIMKTLIALTIAMVLSFTVKLIIEHIGGDLGIIIAIIVTVVTLYYTGQFNLDFTSVKTVVDSVTAIATVANQVIDIYVHSGMVALQEEYDDFLKDQEEQQEEIDEIWDMLGPEDSPIDILFITQNTSMINREETPSDFFDRTLASNPGVKTLSVIEDFASNALKLPEANYLGQTLLA